MQLLPTFKLGKHDVTRFIIGGNPFSGFSHISGDMDQDFLNYYTMPNLQAALDEAWANGLNTVQSRGDRHQMRMMLEHRLRGGQMQWLAQTASEFRDLKTNVAQMVRYKPIAIYHHGTHTDNTWHAGKIDEIRDIVKFIKDQGLPAGIGTHIPEVVQYAEEHEWETDFYMTCFYNLARGYKLAVAEEQDAYRRDEFPKEDPDRMAATIRQTPKPCLAFKIMAASRNCATPADVRRAFQHAYDHIKPGDGVIVGMFQKHKNQIKENAQFVREILRGAAR